MACLDILEGLPAGPSAWKASSYHRALIPPVSCGDPRTACYCALVSSASFIRSQVSELPQWDPARTLDKALPETQKRWRSRFPQASPEALDLLYQLLQIDPERRITAEEALAHPYVATFHDPSCERTALRPVNIPIDDASKKSVVVYRERLYHEVHKAKQRANKSHAENDAPTNRSEGVVS